MMCILIMPPTNPRSAVDEKQFIVWISNTLASGDTHRQTVLSGSF